MPKTFGELRTRVRASRRMRTSECMRPHASRRIAAQRCRGGGVLVRAATLLSMRGEDARCILAKRSQWGACLLAPFETDLRLQKTIDGSDPLFPGCYLQRIVQPERVIRESGAAAKPSPRERAARALISPRVSHGAGAGVGRGVRSELAVELGE